MRALPTKSRIRNLWPGDCAAQYQIPFQIVAVAPHRTTLDIVSQPLTIVQYCGYREGRHQRRSCSMLQCFAAGVDFAATQHIFRMHLVRISAPDASSLIHWAVQATARPFFFARAVDAAIIFRIAKQHSAKRSAHGHVDSRTSFDCATAVDRWHHVDQGRNLEATTPTAGIMHPPGRKRQRPVLSNSENFPTRSGKYCSLGGSLDMTGVMPNQVPG